MGDARDRNVDASALCEDIEQAMVSAARKHFNAIDTDEFTCQLDRVSGKITLRLRNVPWDKALDTILKAKGFDMVRQDNILRIAPAEVIQREREREFEKKNATAKVEDTVIKIITINYATATAS